MRMEPMATDSSWATSRRIQPIADTGTADYRPSLGSHRSLDTTPMHITNTHAPSPESRPGDDAPALTTPPTRPLETPWSVLVRAPPTSPTADLAREDDHRIGLFRWAWLNFIARQKRRYWAWCVFCGPHLGQSRRQIVIDVCHGINALKRTVTHPPSEVRGCCVVEFFSRSSSVPALSGSPSVPVPACQPYRPVTDPPSAPFCCFRQFQDRVGADQQPLTHVSYAFGLIVHPWHFSFTEKMRT